MSPGRRSLLQVVLLMAVTWGVLQGWNSHRAQADATAVASAARAGDIVMLSSNRCAYCTLARRWFTANAVPFSECFIETDAACAARYQAAGAAGTPTLLVRGKRQVGLSASAVAQALER